jgi:hypothetical protein
MKQSTREKYGEMLRRSKYVLNKHLSLLERVGWINVTYKTTKSHRISLTETAQRLLREVPPCREIKVDAEPK